LFHFIRNIEDQPVGGKARGLKVLKELGLRVPESFVIIHPNGYDLPEDVLSGYLRDLGDGPKAVRSSAVSEDGYHASFAGQFDSYLNVSGTALTPHTPTGYPAIPKTFTTKPIPASPS
jgi:phosphoenolpyruvate synthase/pyruvate phosphate dikinase